MGNNSQENGEGNFFTGEGDYSKGEQGWGIYGTSREWGGGIFHMGRGRGKNWEGGSRNYSTGKGLEIVRCLLALRTCGTELLP